MPKQPVDKKFRQVAQTLAGLEEVLAGELRKLGAENIEQASRAVAYTGTLKTLYLTNLSSRTAIRVLVPIADFACPDENVFYEELRKIKWEEFFSIDATFAVEAITAASAMTHSKFVALKAKDAIVDRFRDRFNRRPDVERKNPDMNIHIRISKDHCTVSLDSTGTPLYKRGYRGDSALAPINESLAAGLIMLTGWDKISPLVDPMCGSGTFLIEAALMAKNMPPSFLRRNWTFMKWKRYLPYHAQLFNEARDEVFGKKTTRVNTIISGSDIDFEVVGAARDNVKAARMSHEIRIENMPFDQTIPPHGGGIVILNPPYGERITPEDINKLYKEIGDHLKKKYIGYTAWILTSNEEAEKHIGLHPSKRYKVFNGPLECNFMRFELYSGTRKVRGSKADSDYEASKLENGPEKQD